MSQSRSASLPTPPQAFEAEKAVLGAILIEPEIMPSVLEILPPSTEWFYHRAHQLIYQAMITLMEQQQTPDLYLVSDVLHRRGQLQQVGGSTYLASLMELPTTASVRHYARLVREKYFLRSVINLGSTLQADAYEQRDLEAILTESQQALLALAQQQQGTPIAGLHELITEAILRAEQAHGEGLTGITTGFPDLDHLTNGLHASDLIIIAARPGAGKTSMALQLALAASQSHTPPQPVLIFSLEMSRRQLVDRLLCSEARIDSMRLRRGTLTHQEWDRLFTAADRLRPLPILIDDTPSLTVLDIRARCKRQQQEGGLVMVVIDYLQLLHSHRRVESRVQEVSEISRELKILAKELEIPVVTLSQLNRSVEHRSPPIPVLSDLRDSGSIEQDADVIVFIYRADLYDRQADPVAQIHIAKQRNGPLGEIRLHFHRASARFDSLAEPED